MHTKCCGEMGKGVFTIMKSYGKELILDLHECDPSKFNREDLDIFFAQLCELLDMKKCERYWWDDYGLPKNQQQTEPHLKGTSAVQFIMTSNITIHTLDIMERVYLNIFSCKSFSTQKATLFCRRFFNGKIVQRKVVDRV